MYLSHRLILLCTLLCTSSIVRASTCSSINVHHLSAGDGVQFIDNPEILHDLRQSRPTKPSENMLSAISDLNSSSDCHQRGEEAYNFLTGLANSQSFRQIFWHRAPLLLRANNTGSQSAKNWMDRLFTLEKDIYPRVERPGGSYMAGHKTADSLRQQQPLTMGLDGTNAVQTTTWKFTTIKDVGNEGSQALTTTRTDIEKGLAGGTIYFNTAGGLWPHSLGALCRLCIGAFGIPTNVNVYLTAPQVTLSVPPHTDRQDVLVFQTQGSKRWRVYAPPRPRKPNVDALNRGKQGDSMDFANELGTPIIDAVLRPGDFLYVPTGFPHTTDTCTVVDAQDGDDDAAVTFNDTSVHLTMGLDTHVWGLTLAHLRWSVLQRCGKSFQIKIDDDDVYWTALESMPMGFLLPISSESDWLTIYEELKDKSDLKEEWKTLIRDQLKQVMHLLEPNRWKQSDTDNKEEIPTDEELDDVIDYMFTKHLKHLVTIQKTMFTYNGDRDDDVGIMEEESLIKAFNGTQDQNRVMQEFGIFSKNEQLASSFAQRHAQVQEQLRNRDHQQ